LLEVEVTAGMDDELGGGGVLRAHVVEPDGARGASATPPVVAGQDVTRCVKGQPAPIGADRTELEQSGRGGL
jgi:hypothetical protein